MHGACEAVPSRPAGLVPPLVHELKSALASVVQGSELLAEGMIGPLSPQQREVTAVMRDNSYKLQLLTEYLAAYGLWRDQNGQPRRLNLTLKPLLQRWVQRYQGLAGMQGVRVELDSEEIEVFADATALGLIFDNLVTHALQVSPRGGAVQIGATLDARELLLEVADGGPRLEPEQFNGLLASFGTDFLIWKGDRPARGGLAVARECARALGGCLELGQPGARGGAVLRARLPAAETSGVVTHG